jgi:hypothetical protein
MVVTSCNRHDLLKQTLDSFVASVDIAPETTIIVEDGLANRPEWLVQPQLGNIVWLQNEKRLGQGHSIDRAYAAVNTECLFHCEDDWEFLQPGPFIAKSLEILAGYPKVLTVTLTNHKGWMAEDPAYPFLINRPSKAGMSRIFDGLTWNPGLRRLSDYKLLGTTFGELSRKGNAEVWAANEYLRLGYFMADVGTKYVAHLGNGRRCPDAGV